MSLVNPRRKTKAEVLLESIDEHDNIRSNSTPIEDSANGASTNAVIASPIKKSERPETNKVQNMIKLQEQQARENLGNSDTQTTLSPFPAPLFGSPVKNKKNIFVTLDSIHKENGNDDDTRKPFKKSPMKRLPSKQIYSSPAPPSSDQLSKSEINTMNKITSHMPNSPSKQNIEKLKAIQSKLDISATNRNVTDSGNAVRVPKTFSTKNINKHLTNLTSMKSDNDDLKLLTFICRILEIKNWIESLLGIDLDLDIEHLHEFPDYLTNGVLLAEVAKHFDTESDTKRRIFNPNFSYKSTKKKDFRFTENIVYFLDFTKTVKLPSMFIFETNDLYEKKNIPKVIACLHALSYLMSLSKGSPSIESMEIRDLKIDNDQLYKIKHSIGGLNLRKKYIEGFDEAIRVNLRDDIKPKYLLQIDVSTPPIETINPTNNTEDSKRSVDSDSVNETKDENPFLVVENIQTKDEATSFCTFQNVVQDTKSITMSISSDADTTTDSFLNFPEEEPILSPPTQEQQIESIEARSLFNKQSSIPTMPSVHSFTEIQKKYMYLVEEEDRELLHMDLEGECNLNREDEKIIQLQAVARGSLMRFSLFVDKMMLEKNEPSITRFQSVCRGLIYRQKTKKQTRDKSQEFGSSNMMQTILKNKSHHLGLIKELPTLRKQAPMISVLQSSIRGKIIRDKYWQIRKSLLSEMNYVIKIQSKVRGDKTRADIKNNNFSNKPLVQQKNHIVKVKCSTHVDSPFSQKPSRFEDDLFENFDIPTGKTPNKKVFKSNFDEQALTPSLSPKKVKSSKLQQSPTKKSLKSFIKPQLTTKTPSISLKQENELLKYHSDHLIKLQSIARGKIFRIRLNRFHQNISSNINAFCNFNSICKGVLERNKYKQIRQQLYMHQNEIIHLQCLLRGIDARVAHDCLIEDLKDYTPEIKQLQSIIRGAIVRKRNRDLDDYYKKPDNLKKIIKLQAIIRGFKGSQDFKALINQQNPPLSAVKRFIGLLAGSQGVQILNEENEIMKLNVGIIDEQKRVRDEIEKLKLLKNKVIVLRKYGIRLENIENEVNFSLQSGAADIKSADLKIDENKTKIQHLEQEATEEQSPNKSLGKFFWLLQHKNYWAKVLDSIEIEDTIVEFSYGNIEHWVLKCFNYNDLHGETAYESTKEEGLFMKLIVSTFKYYLERFKSFDDLKAMIKSRRELNCQTFNWELLIHEFLNMPQMRKMMRNDFGDILLFVTSEYDNSFEADPMIIFDNNKIKLADEDVIGVEVGNLSPLDVSFINKEFVKNMQNLRDTVYEIFMKIFREVNKIPMFLRCLCKELYGVLCSSFEIPEVYKLGMIGSIFMKCYIIPMFIKPNNYSINIEAFEEYADNVLRNLELTSILINQCVFMKPFETEQQPYLRSLNGFIDELKDPMKVFLRDLINVSSLDLTYKKNFTVEENPLKVQYSDTIELVSIWRDFEKEIIKDKLLEITIEEISHLKTIKYDLYGYIKIPIENNLDEDEDAINSKLLLQAKKYLIYILQIQTGEDLIDLLVSQITPADELKFKEIVKLEKKMNIKSEVHSLSFPEVKKRTIEFLHHLQQRGVTSSHDGYSSILNSIANDIRHKRDIKDKRKEEKQVIVDTITELKRRTNFYHNIYNEYDALIKQTLRERLKSNLFNETDLKKSSNNNSLSSFSASQKASSLFSKIFRKSGTRFKFKSSIGSDGKLSNTSKVTILSRSSNKSKDKVKIPMKSLIEKGIFTVDSLTKTTGDAILRCTGSETFALTTPGNSGITKHLNIDELLSKTESASDRALLRLVLSSFYV